MSNSNFRESLPLSYSISYQFGFIIFKSQSLKNMEKQNITIPSIPAFTLYRLNSQQLQTCFQSKDTKIVCSITGPYYVKSNSTSSNMLGSGGSLSLSNLQPNFDIAISLPNVMSIRHSSSDILEHDDLQQQINMHLTKINKTVLFLKTALKNVLSQAICSEDYQRMNFDVSLTVVEINLPKMLKQKPQLEQNLVPQMLLTKMANLVCYTMLLANIQIKFTFTGALVILNCQNQRLYWLQQISQQVNQSELMCMGVVFEHRDKQLVFSSWRGYYKFALYQKILNYCENACTQINEFIAKKIESLEKQTTVIQTE